MPRTKFLFPSAVWPVILWIVFAGVYAGFFFAQRAALLEHYQYQVSRIPSVMLYGSGTASTLAGYGSSYGGFIGIALGLIYLILAYVVLGLFALIRLTKMKFGAMLAFLLAALPIGVLAYVLHTEPQPRTAIAAALANFVSFPLWDAALALTCLLVLLLILSFFYGTASSADQKA